MGSIASGIGEVVVGTTDALAETGLLDKTGKVGDALGFTADVTNLTQGKVSNYMSQTRSGKEKAVKRKPMSQMDSLNRLIKVTCLL